MDPDKNSAWEGSLEAVAATEGSENLGNSDAVDEERTASRKKACCVCGKDVAHEQRFKDKSGHYWCTDCNRLDEAKKHPAQCPDCQKDLTEADLVDYQGKKICKECAEKQALSAKREAARKAAAEAEEQLQRERNRLWLLVICGLVGVGAVYLLVRYLIGLIGV